VTVNPMRRALPAIADLLLRTLDPSEREAVEGDLRELGLSRRRAVREVLGLVVRRQIAAWRQPNAWAALFIFALPLAMMLSLLSRHWAHATALSCWFYIENWTPAYLDSPAARGDLIGSVAASAIESMSLILWAWSLGVAVASLSRRTAWTTFVLFAATVFAGTTGTTTVGARNPANAAVFSAALYRVGLPFAFRVVFVVVPALRGIRRAGRKPALAHAHGIALAAAVALLTPLVWRDPQGALLYGWWLVDGDHPVLVAFPRLRDVWPLQLLPIGMAVPAIYVLWQAGRRSRDQV
jgi:hypothetical protein